LTVLTAKGVKIIANHWVHVFLRRAEIPYIKTDQNKIRFHNNFEDAVCSKQGLTVK